MTPARAVELLRDAIRCVDDAASRDAIAIVGAGGRVLAEFVRSDRPSPPVDVSAMDGYAIRRADLGELAGAAAAEGGPTVIAVRVAGEVRVGAAPPELPPNACIRITTGGAVPAGADAIVRREDVRERVDGRTDGGCGADATVAAIEIAADAALRVRAGQHIRRRGENAAADARVLEPGRVLDAASIAALAAFGRERVQVRRRLRVAILTTGDELEPPGAPIEPWQIRDSNGPALESLLRSRPWIGEIDRSHVGDDLEATVDRIAAAVRSDAERSADALVLTGGVSMGHRDFVPAALARCGIRTLFHHVPQRPGRPILGAITADGRPVLALPGNPVSVLVTARRFLVPALAMRAGISSPDPAPCLELVESDGTRLELWWHRLVRVESPGRASLVEARGSGDLVAAARADGVVEIPPGETGPGPWPFRAW